MRKGLIVFLVLGLASCSTHEDRERLPSSSQDRSSNEADTEYWSHRGEDWAKFSYDGFSARDNRRKFFDAVKTKSNRDFSFELSGRRQELFEKNLFDTGVSPNADLDCSKVMKRVHRTASGECYFHGQEKNLRDQDKNLVNQMRMGAQRERFGRNFKSETTNDALKEDMMSPNPLEVSQKLLARIDGKQTDAPVINVLATAWLQAMNHDWFTHGKNSKSKHYDIDAHKSNPHFSEGMKIPATQSETNEESAVDSHGYDATFRNDVTHWWDASQIYGSDAETIKKVRSVWRDGKNTGRLIDDGKIAVDVANRKLRYDEHGAPITGFHDNWWTGLELIHTLFHLEHNYIVDNVLKPRVGTEICIERGVRTSKEDCADEMFEKARMINSALIAKIHTAEWTPALLDNEMLHIGMRSNWFGMREVFGINFENLRGRFDGSLKHLLSGLVGKNTLDLYSVPFTLTEEFVAVYRMHPLVPDFVTIRDSKSNKAGEKVSTKDMIFREAQGTMSKYGSATWLNSFGTSFPGAMTLHNHPTWMSKFVAERNLGHGHGAADATSMDMGAVDIFRDRERGVPRYNEFRRKLHMPEIKSFSQLTPNEEDQRILSEVYDGDIEKVDLLVGTLAEADRYPGYAFGNTPFYIFALMASRRLMADPFFSDYFTKEYYTGGGINHVQKSTMSDVIVRHFPEFRNRFYATNKGKRKSRPVLVVKNAFRPWLPVYQDVKKAIKGMDSL